MKHRGWKVVAWAACAALAYNQHHQTPWLFVCSWSEWHEGSQIEHTSDFANPQAFLEVLHDELAAAGWL